MGRYRFWAGIQLVATLALLVAVVVLTFYAFRTHDALCTLKGDLQRRHDAGVQYLVDHPEGIAGISAADLQRSLTAQQSTLDSLHSLSC